MKTQEELNALKEEVETVGRKLHGLTDEELAQVTSGLTKGSFTYSRTKGPFTYGMSDTMDRMHSDAQLAGAALVDAASDAVKYRMMRDAKITEIYE